MPATNLAWLTERPIAHRGLHDLAAGRPENSLAAFAAAVERGYAIECDLHPAADRVPMVFHDDTLERLTGERHDVRDRSAAELRRLALLGTGETIPLLDDLLDLVDGRVPLVIELKSVAGRDAGFAAIVAERLKRYRGPAAVMSFDAGLIADLRAAAPDLPCGLTAEGDAGRALRHLRTVLAHRVAFISYRIEDLPTPAPLFARSVLGLPLICWTVRSPAQLEKARRWTDQITFEGFLP